MLELCFQNGAWVEGLGDPLYVDSEILLFCLDSSNFTHVLVGFFLFFKVTAVKSV